MSAPPEARKTRRAAALLPWILLAVAAGGTLAVLQVLVVRLLR